MRSLADGAFAVCLECDRDVSSRVKYAFDSIAMALGVRFKYLDRLAANADSIVYTQNPEQWLGRERVAVIRHVASYWVAGTTLELTGERLLALWCEPGSSWRPSNGEGSRRAEEPIVIDFDLPSAVFYFLSARSGSPKRSSRQLFRDSLFARLDVSLDFVDQCLQLVRRCIESLGGYRAESLCCPDHGMWDGYEYAVALTHDVDYLPVGRLDNLKIAAKSAARHLLKQRSPSEALEAAAAYIRAVASGQDPYGCVPAILAEEKRRGVRSSFQVAVGHRHERDVNYRIEDDRIRDYLSVITREGFDLCLHGSYRSTEQAGWYEEEVELLALRLGLPIGSRQHFLSFDAERLFAAQERAGIQYDMSMGFPDHTGSRVGFSHPYFPFSKEKDRPYDVVEIPLVLMDVTLRSYMGLRGEAAWAEIERQLEVVRKAGGAVSVVWHPIVFGGARDPGFEKLYWRLVEYVQATGGLATDGRTINEIVRKRAREHASFAGIAHSGNG